MNGPLRVPRTETTQHCLLDADNRRLREEIEHLPYADIPSALTLAFRRLHTFNRFTMPPGKRLQTVALFHYAFTRFSDYYRDQLGGQLFARDIASSELDNLMEFIQELGFAYKHIIRDSQQRKINPSNLAIVVFMAMLYQHYLGLFSYNRGRMLKRTYWQEFHYLYFLARDLGVETNQVACPGGQTGTVASLYHQALLLGLAAPYSLSANEQWHTNDYAARCSGQVKLLAPESIDQLSESYHVAPNCRHPAFQPGSDLEAADEHRILDISTVIDYVYRQLANLKTGGDLRQTGLRNLSRKQTIDLLTRLADRWSRSTQRNGIRRAINEKIGLVWGLENICTMLDPEMRQHDMGRNQNKLNAHRAWSHASNESNSGIRVKLAGEDSRYPETGQAIALIRELNGRKVLEVGLVRWAALSSEDTPECGIERLQGNVKKVALQQNSEELTERNGLLVVSRSVQKTIRAQLLAPGNAVNVSESIVLQMANRGETMQAEQVQLKRRTRNVDVFDVTLRTKQ